MPASVALSPHVPSYSTPTVFRAFSRVYGPRATTSCLDEIHIWSQRAKVPRVEWELKRAIFYDGCVGFRAMPWFPDVRGFECQCCVGRGPTQEDARQAAIQLLLNFGIEADSPHVRWKFIQFNSPFGIANSAIPVVYGPPALLHDNEVIGYGSTRQEAKESSAFKLFERGCCVTDSAKMLTQTIWKTPIISRLSRSRCMSDIASSTYQRPLLPGRLPVYDLAVQLIEKDSAAKISLLEGEKDPQKRAKLEIQSKINLPQVRWAFANGKCALIAAENTGHLLTLHQTTFHSPYIVIFWNKRGETKVRSTFCEEVVPGVFLPVKSTLSAPSINAQPYHPEDRLYTLLVVDPDVPDPSARSFSTYLHALLPNVALSAEKTQISLPTAPDASGTVLAYIPPHPQHGTAYHRYTTLLLPQTSKISVELSKLPREHFDVRSFHEQHAFTSGGGIHMFREKWDESVSVVYKRFFDQPEPKFGKAPKPEPYLDATGRRPPKYTMA
ncbi:54S ribosomal protein L35 [Ceratobasidium theobromae]|uniref:54S ribosomal protein L35 n=1 Tax=Ceratobasidium theobromae TaxID=1582974 RepID=A0A5N5QMF9_9AGAM|nr:54S ribosomal protein L35 [Ceratobasidium theobromae]